MASSRGLDMFVIGLSYFWALINSIGPHASPFDTTYLVVGQI
jgi:hypothetical protein